MGDNYDFNGTAQFSLSLWIYRTATTGQTYQSLISKHMLDGSGRQGWSSNICNGCGDTTRGFSCERYINGSNQVSVDATGSIPLNQWVHFGCTFDGGRLRVYRDGVLANTGSNAGLSMINHAGIAVIGNANSNTTAAPAWNGGNRARFDEARIYSRLLTAADMMTLALPCNGPDAGKIDYYSTNDNHLRYCNGVYWEMMTSRSAGSSCSNPGQWFFEATSNNVMMFCNGSNLYSMGPNSAGGAGCSSPTGSKGTLYFDSTSKFYKYCNGASWVNVGT